MIYTQRITNYSKAILVLLISLMLTNCGEIQNLHQEDLKKLCGLDVFISDVSSFDGTRDIDTDEISIYFESDIQSGKYFDVIEKAATNEKWELLFAREDKRVFAKEMLIYGTTVDLIIVEIYHYEPNRYSLVKRGS